MSQTKVQAALELAINGIAGLIPAVTIASSASGTVAVFTTDNPHLLTTNLSVSIDNHVGCVPAVSGSYKVVVVDATKFSLVNQVTDQPISLTSGGIGGTVTADLTVWENTTFIPVVGVPYQRVNVLFGKPQDPVMGSSMRREIGFMQVTLYYPKQVGTRDINARIEMLRQLFRRGSSFVFDGVTVNIPNTLEKLTGSAQEQAYVVAVRIPFWSDIFV